MNALFMPQVVFANNPLTGLIILLALTWADPMVGLAATVAATTAIITAWVNQSAIFIFSPEKN